MAKITHNISFPNDGLGDALRTAMSHQNSMNTELYDTKVDKVDGFGLSENNLTDALVVKIESLGTPYIPTLQEVLNNNHALDNGRNFQGEDAGYLQTGVDVNFFGTTAGLEQSGNNVNGYGNSALKGNSGNDVSGFGNGAGNGNTFNRVNLFGPYAQADADNQTVFSNYAYNLRLDFGNIVSSDKKQYFPNKNGTFAMLDDTLKSEYKTDDFTAENGKFYVVKSTTSIDITDPTSPNAGDGYVFYVISGYNVTVGGSDTFFFRAIVYRYYNGSAWTSVDASNISEINEIYSILNTKEFVNNKQSDLTASTTKYPTVNAVNTGLALKVDKVTGKSLINDTEITRLGTMATNANVGVVPNTAITGATKTKITYDSKGLVTAGVDATTADIADTTNKRYATDAQLTAIGNSIKSIVKDCALGSTVTGVTTETLTGTYLIPANTLSATDILKIMAFTAEKTGTAGTATMRVKVGSTNVFSSATTIATYTISGTNLSATVVRNSLTIRSSNIRALAPTSSNLSDIVVTNAGFTNVAFNPAVDNYIFTSLQLTVGTDSVFQSNFIVTN